MKNIFITGSTGQLGGELKRLCPTAVFPTRDDVDLSSEESIRAYFSDKNPHIIINCAAYTQVDKAESDKELAFKVNSLAPAVLASLCDKVILFSTDYVFDGGNSAPYSEKCFTAPTGIYGESKLEGEKKAASINPKVVIIRTSWVYSDIGNNFVKTMIRLGKERKELKVVADQVGTPTYAKDLADVIVQNAIENWKFEGGIYHFSNEGVASWFDFATEIMDYLKIDCQVLPIKTSEYPTIAKRPAYSVLDKTKIKNELGI
jgi:dTDP-4-dehydrorhamnose reductase